MRWSGGASAAKGIAAYFKQKIFTREIDTIILGEGAGSLTADVIFSAWLQRFFDTMNSRDAENIAQFFKPEGYWTDIVAFTREHRCVFRHIWLLRVFRWMMWI